MAAREGGAPVRYGSQEPTFEVLGGYYSTTGLQAVALFAHYGIGFYPSQERELSLFLARDEDGRVAAKTIGISKPRQNGKSFAARFYAVWCAAVEGKAVLYTAHHGATSREMFKQLRNFVERTPDFRAALAKEGVRRASGNEGIYFANGGCIELNTRTNSAARGRTYDVIIVDEAQELTDEQYDALTPTKIASASGDPQMIYLGTPPNEKCLGTVFRRMHEKAHSDEPGTAWWLEWATDKVGDPMDAEEWYRCCPAMGYRIREDVMADAASNATEAPDGFAREYLGWWSPLHVPLPPALSKEDWEACRVDAAPRKGRVCYGVKFSPDGTRYALAACARPKGGVPFVEVVAARSARRGVRQLARWLAERAGRAAHVSIDGLSKADALEARVREAGAPEGYARVASTAEAVAACTTFAEAVESGMVSHAGQPGLAESATESAKRVVSRKGGWLFGENGGADPLPVEACALAYRAAMTAKRKPGKEMLVG